jgi:hypothetical protein
MGPAVRRAGVVAAAVRCACVGFACVGTTGAAFVIVVVLAGAEEVVDFVVVVTVVPGAVVVGVVVTGRQRLLKIAWPSASQFWEYVCPSHSNGGMMSSPPW